MKSSLSLLITIFILLLLTLDAVAGELFLYAGAGLRKPTDKIIERFEKETGHKVIVNYGGSGKQLSRYLAAGQGDLFMPGSTFYIDKLSKMGLSLSQRNVALHTPVIAVNKLAKQDIRTLEGMAAPGVRLAMGDPKAMALGRTSMAIIKNAGLEKKILGNVVVYGATVNQLALYVVERTVDAAIVGRANAFMHQDTLDMYGIPKDLYTPEIIGIAVLKTTTDPKLSDAFQTFVAGPEGVAFFKSFGFLALDK